MDPALAAASTAELAKLGLAGVVIFALAWAWLRERTLVNEIQEKRITDTRDMARALEASTDATRSQTEGLNNLRLLVQGLLK